MPFLGASEEELQKSLPQIKLRALAPGSDRKFLEFSWNWLCYDFWGEG